jgi:hypothetical protein
LVAENGICTNHDDKAELIYEYYEGLIGNGWHMDHTIDLQALGILSHDLADLELPFSEEEVWAIIKQMPSDKAPGPDGFTELFFKTCWSVIKGDIMASMSAVWSRKFLNFSNLNSAYITLIPKVEGAEQVKDFKPIIVHSFAKLVTKVLANRLVVRLNSMVSPVQSAFIKGRFIQDNFMLVEQTARFLHQKKLSRILLKIDISKAFDSVSWPFLLEVMQNLGFGQIWRGIISGLLSSASTQVLLNGIPGDTICHMTPFPRCSLYLPWTCWAL